MNLRTAVLIGAAVGGSLLAYVIYVRRNRTLRVVVCSSPEEWTGIAQEFLAACGRTRFLGLDCEWISTKEGREKVALLQIAPNEDLCVLIRLCKMECPKDVIDILGDHNVIKLGVAVREDADKLLQDYGVKVQSCLDLRYMTSKLNLDDQSLSGITEKLTGIRMDKSSTIRLSNWEADRLSDRQILYAANDALAPIHCLQALIGGWCWPLTYARCRRDFELFIGAPYKSAKKSKSEIKRIEATRKSVQLSSMEDFIPSIPVANGSARSQDLPDGLISESEAQTFVQTPATQESGEAVLAPHLKCIRKDQQLYKNAIMQAPDGEVLCSTDKLKTDWYLKMNLATLVSEDPFTIRLKFEPRCRAILGGEYYVDEKFNLCVVCGSEKDLLKKNVVPMEYRKLFPPLMKAHTSHDSVLICVTCQQRCVMADARLRALLDEQCPFYGEIPDFQTLKRAARALQTSWVKLPIDRRASFIQVLEEHYNRPLDDEMLAEASLLDSRVWMQENGANHARRVVDKYMEEEGLFALEKLWRQHFLDNMEPRHLPEKWSVCHNHDAVLMKVATGRDIGALDIEEFLRILGVSWSQMASLVKSIVDEGLVEADKIVIYELLAQKGFITGPPASVNGRQ